MNEELNKTEDNPELTDQVTEDTLSEEEKASSGGVPVRQQLLLVAVLLTLIFGTTVSTKVYSMINTKKHQDITEVKNTPQKPTHSEVKTEEDKTNTYEEVALVGQAAYVWDVNAQRALYKKNETEVLPLASVTKLMTALLANEILEEESDVAISDSALRQDGDSGLLLHEVFGRQTLSDLVLMSSSNDGAYALAISAGSALDDNDGAGAFIKAMNVRAKEMGLNNTTFNNPTGLDVSTTQAGAYGSAKDMAFLMEYIVKNEPDILTFTQESSARVYSESGTFHDANNTNYYIDEIPGLIGSKTGYTDLAGGNLVIAYDAGLNRPIIITVLGSTQQNRFTDVMQLVEATNKYLSS